MEEKYELYEIKETGNEKVAEGTLEEITAKMEELGETLPEDNEDEGKEE